MNKEQIEKAMTAFECAVREGDKKAIDSARLAFADEFSRRPIPEDAICFFTDGNQWICTMGDFVDLQTSCAGFGITREQAEMTLLHNLWKRTREQKA